ncbi:hypothetical protein CVT24_010484 [Panaeolus cyanescens]|uniref:DUF6533 domain-containing protein n=1 Tax=Panaeolus cyanescens TaxID=181874 RepID=A0A409YVT8_9AGAR|nr:hypothetical protein CVT24_010484 [Panaeolus cyanescens]
MDANQVLHLLQGSHAMGYMFVSAATLNVYDILLVLDREITHIWKANWSTPKVLYLLTRYYGIVLLGVDLAVYTRVQTSLEWCRRFFWYNMTILTDWPRPGIGDLALSILSVVFVGPLAYKAAFLAPPGLPLFGCLTAPDLSKTIYGWLGGLITAVLLFVMMAFKLLKNHQARPRRTAHNTIPPLILAFYRDGTMAFFLIMFLTIIGFALCFNIEGPLQIAYMPWITVVTSGCGSRLILHLREAVYNDPTQHTEAFSTHAHGANAFRMQSIRFTERAKGSNMAGHKPFVSQDGIAVTVVRETQIDGEARAV